eukprot:9076074-Pyramimonas_sp.AAC.1
MAKVRRACTAKSPHSPYWPTSQKTYRGVSDGLADGHVLAELPPAGGKPCAGGPDGGLRGAVHIPQLANLRDELRLERPREGLAAAQRAKRRGALPVRAHQHAPGRGGRLQDRRPVLLDELAEHGGAARLRPCGEHRTGAADEGEEDLQAGDVKADGGHRHKSVRRGRPQQALRHTRR